ncbi:MAG: ABC transporter ATP-binding protein [Spirochaetaceae bacterium]|jgi:branched-chain amino acid transport system ATP-binding protein|nr:ABC transporter ATP-binding protein [Spirochaetaceae bacterium]
MLEIRDLDFSYGSIRAVKGISMSIARGELVTLIGSNGAGKTTVLKNISGLLRPSGGSISYRGRDITQLPAHRHASMDLIHVPEGRQIFARMTVEENLRMGAYFIRDRGEYKRRAEQALALFPPLARRRRQGAGSLSGGEQQMLAIARALMGNPQLLLLDEPSLGLSPIMTEQVFAVIGDLKQRGITILLVEQNAYEALRISDRAYILETGEITMAGRSADFINNPDIKKAYLGGI